MNERKQETVISHRWTNTRRAIDAYAFFCRCRVKVNTREKEMVCREGIIDTQSHSHIIFALSLSPIKQLRTASLLFTCMFCISALNQRDGTCVIFASHFSSCHLAQVVFSSCSSSHFARFRQREIEPTAVRDNLNEFSSISVLARVQIKRCDFNSSFL